MAAPNTPANFQLFASSVTKQPVLVVEIDGVDDIISSAPVGEEIRYGDPIHYGEINPLTGTTYVYGDLRPYQTPTGGVARSLIMLDRSSLTMSQKLEPEQGRASIGQLSIAFLDLNGYMTNLCTPGKVVPEIMGRQVKVWLGYREISYPDDYLLVFRGRIQSITTNAGVVIIGFGDPNLIRRQNVFFCATTTLPSPLNSTDTIIPVNDNSAFFQAVLGPDGTYDSSVKFYINIDDEIIEYNRQAFGTNTFSSALPGGVVTRGARGSVADSHDAGASVSAAIGLVGNPLILALKIMLSGWGGSYLTAQPIVSFVYTGDPLNPTVANSIRVTEDAVQELGLAIGDYITITGATNPGNNITTRIQSFFSIDDFPNLGIVVVDTLILESSTSAVFSARSQFDTLPLEAGIKMLPVEVDVAGHIALRNLIINNDILDFYINAEESSAKTFIESELYLPVTAYSLTRNGQLSVNVTLPPIAGSTLGTLDSTQVIQPTGITQVRSLTNRKFYNEVNYSYDVDDAGNFTAIFNIFDADSLGNIGYPSTLPLSSRGIKSLETNTLSIKNKALRFLNRYKNACILVTLKTNFGAGNNIQVGDIVLLKDNGTLQISDLTNGTRSSGNVLYEVIDRTLDFKAGNVSFTLQSGVNFSLQDRFAGWAPSSNISPTGSTTTSIRIVPSYGALFGSAEYLKWNSYIGEDLKLRKNDYSAFYTTTLTGLGANPNDLQVNPPLAVTPDNTYVLELGDYSTSSSQSVDQISKISHVFWDRSAPVVSGGSTTTFTVGAGDVARFQVGFPLRVHNPSYSNVSSEVTIASVVGNVITASASLGFTPDNTCLAELLSFPDLQGPYRWV